jgi:REP element-mobilizing transposase RayT
VADQGEPKLEGLVEGAAEQLAEADCLIEGRHLWSRGYCVSTVGLDEEKIRKYVIWQEKREKQLEAIQGELFD